eukprot:11871379-Alexandrium_andersonii.AAC.1
MNSAVAMPINISVSTMYNNRKATISTDTNSNNHNTYNMIAGANKDNSTTNDGDSNDDHGNDINNNSSNGGRL